MRTQTTILALATLLAGCPAPPPAPDSQFAPDASDASIPIDAPNPSDTPNPTDTPNPSDNPAPSDAPDPPDGGGVACTNIRGAAIDPTLECTVSGHYCKPGSAFDTGGTCTAGDNCDPVAASGCAASQSCLPTSFIALDNTNATVCQPSGTTSVFESCTPGINGSSCALGLYCSPVSATEGICLKICRITENTGCEGVMDPGGDTPTTCTRLFDPPAPAWLVASPFGACL